MERHITIGMDLGDRSHVIVEQDEHGDDLECTQLVNTKVSLRRYFQRYRRAAVAVEAGMHSPWISRELGQLGCRVYVGNPRKCSDCSRWPEWACELPGLCVDVGGSRTFREKPEGGPVSGIDASPGPVGQHQPPDRNMHRGKGWPHFRVRMEV
jgi:hypothetical protein